MTQGEGGAGSLRRDWGELAGNSKVENNNDHDFNDDHGSNKYHVFNEYMVLMIATLRPLSEIQVSRSFSASPKSTDSPQIWSRLAQVTFSYHFRYC